MSENDKYDYAKSILQSNFKIMYNHLIEAIQVYLDSGHTNGDYQYIEAYLAATIHSIMDYAERYMENDDIVNACRYVNNILKHNPNFVTHKKITGGMEFPISFPICIEEIKVVWNYDEALSVHSPKQKPAFENIFAGRPIIETLKPIAKMIVEGVETRCIENTPV